MRRGRGQAGEALEGDEQLMAGLGDSGTRASVRERIPVWKGVPEQAETCHMGPVDQDREADSCYSV